MHSLEASPNDRHGQQIVKQFLCNELSMASIVQTPKMFPATSTGQTMKQFADCVQSDSFSLRKATNGEASLVQ